MNHRGMTLLELMVALVILTAIMGILFVLAQSVGATAQNQEAKLTSMDEARRVTGVFFFAGSGGALIWAFQATGAMMTPALVTAMFFIFGNSSPTQSEWRWRVEGWSAPTTAPRCSAGYAGT